MQPGLITLVENVDVVFGMIREAVNFVFDAAQTVITTLQNLWVDVQPALQAFAEGIGGVLQPVIDALGGIVTAVDDVKNGLSSIPGVAGQAGDIAEGFVQDPGK